MKIHLRSAIVGSATAIALLAVPGAALASSGNGEMPPGMSVMMNAPGHEHFMASPGHEHVMGTPGHMAMMALATHTS
jgi:hypothetical protein